MDHTYISGIERLLILVDSFSRWPEVVHVRDRKAETIKQILRVIFSRNGVSKILVSDNAPKFCEVLLCKFAHLVEENQMYTL